MKYRVTVGSLLIDMSAAYPSTYRPTLSANSRSTMAQHIGQHVNQESYLAEVGPYVDRYDDQVSADISADTSIEYRPILSTDT